MSKLDELIQKLCPNGVNFYSISQLVNSKKIKTLTPSFKVKKDKYLLNGIVPIISQEAEYISGYYDIYDKNIVAGEYVLFGDHTEIVKYVDFNFVQGADGLKIIKILDHSILTKYLYYAVLTFYKKHNNYERHFKYFLETTIPVPPLEVQDEIVRILDNFTELTEELTEELTARRKQYEYYRNELFIFDTKHSSAQLFKIKDICTRICSGGTPNTSNRKYYDGNIPWLRTQEVNFGPITDTDVKITEEGLNASSAKWVNKNAVIVAMYGATVGKVAYTNIALTTNQACCNLEIDNKKAVYKYVYYYLTSKYEYIKSLGQGSQTNINADIVKNLDIFLPNLDEQQRIVDILDKFDAYCNDLTQGIPAEISARQKQYEYYRDKLLTFKNINEE